MEAFEAALLLFEKDPSRRASIRAAAPVEFHEIAPQPLSRPEALLELKNNHESQAFPSPPRVHSSWRKALLAKQPTSVVKGLTQLRPATHGTLVDLAMDAAQVLTYERLVGDVPPIVDDLPILRLFQGEVRQQWLRRIVWAGRLKRALGSSGPQGPFESLFQNQPTQWPALAASTLARFFSGLPSKAKSDGHLGLVTVASLTSRLEPRRRQWVLQHLSMEFGPLLATWLRIGKPPWPDDQLALENWIAEQATMLADGVQVTDSEEVHVSLPPEPPAVATRPAEIDIPDESVELLQTISTDSALFDIDIPGLDELDIDEDNDESDDDDQDEDDSSFRLGDLTL